MRLTDVVIASLILGAGLSVLTSGKPNAASLQTTAGVASERSVTERVTWLRTPSMRRATSI